MKVNEFKNCPFCDEEIKVNAIKCRYCQSYLTDSKENDNEELKNADKGVKPPASL